MRGCLDALAPALGALGLEARQVARPVAPTPRFADYFARWRAHVRPPEVICVTDGTDVVASAVVGRGAQQGLPGAAAVRVDVREAWRGRGVGRLLAAYVEARARAIGAEELVVTVPGDDAAARGFALRRGLRERSRVDRWSLDLLARSGPEAAASAGTDRVRLATYRELQDQLRQEVLDGLVGRLHRDIVRDLPRAAIHLDLSASQYSDIYLRNAHFRADATFLAFRGARPLGLTLTFLDGEVAWSVLTGTIGALRPSHAARALKRAAAERLRALGARRLFASADTDNAPLGRVFASLGYVRDACAIRYARRLRRARV